MASSSSCCLQMIPIQLLDEVYRSLTERLTFLDDVNADDAGRGIVEAQQRYILSASKGAIFILISTCHNSLTNVSDDVQVPVGAVNLDHYVRSNVGRTNLPLDSVEKTVAWLANLLRPIGRDGDAENFLAVPVISDVACSTVANTLQYVTDNILAWNGPILPPLLPPQRPDAQACVRAYKRCTNFKTTVLGMPTIAIPTADKNSGWSLLRTVVEGQQMNVFAPFRDMCTRAEFIAAAYFRRLLDAVGWAIVNGAWKAEPYQRYGGPVNGNEARFRVCKITNLRVEHADLGLVGGPTMTFCPAPPPRELAAAIAGAVGAGLAPLIQPLQPGVAPGAALPAAPAPPAPGVGGVGDNAVLPKAGAPLLAVLGRDLLVLHLR